MSPEAKYHRVIAELERVLSADPRMTGGRVVMPGDAGSATTTTKYTVGAPESITLPKDGSAPRVNVEVTQVSSYSFLPAAKPEGEDEAPSTASSETGKPSGDPMSELGSNLKEMGVEVLDPEQMKKDLEKAAGGRVGPPAMRQTVNAEKHVHYELIYENDRWRLARPPAADALESTNIAIQQALQRQL